MRYPILATIAFALSLTIQAQNYKADIQTQFNEYTSLLVKKEFAKSLQYMNPEFLKLVPKEQLVKVMEAAFSNPEIEMVMDNPRIVSIGEKKTIGGMNYVKMMYTNNLNMRFKGEATAADTGIVKTALQGQFGEENVTYNPKTKFYRIKVTKPVIANSADNKKWTFIVVEDKQKAVLQKFIPKELLQ